MAKGLIRSMSRGSKQLDDIIKQVVRIRSLPINVDGLTGNGWGTVVLSGLPEGNVLFNGCVCYLTVRTAAAGIIATFTGSYALGTTATTDSTVSGTEINIVPATTLAAATAGVSPRTRGSSGATESGVIFNNTTNTLRTTLNLLIDDASISANGQACTVDADVFLSYIMLGDN
jgi:hypothetical protein